MDDGNWTMTMVQQQCNGNRWPATCRMLASAALGWEFQFLVQISWTPIVSGILILFLILENPVEIFFFEIPMSQESENWNSDLQNTEFG